MKSYKMILGAIAAFDLAYLGFICAEDCYSRLRSCWKKKHGTDDTDDLEFFEEEEEDLSLAPPLCVDAIRMVYPSFIRNLVEDRIIPEGKVLVDALEEADRDAAVLLLTAYIRYLDAEAPQEEKNFPTLLEILNASEVRPDPEYVNAVDIMLEQSASGKNPLPLYYTEYQEYKITCAHKERVVNACRVMVSGIIRKLYGDYYDMHVEQLCKTVPDRLADAADDALWDGEVE